MGGANPYEPLAGFSLRVPEPLDKYLQIAKYLLRSYRHHTDII
jgi:hypothetical protein